MVSTEVVRLVLVSLVVTMVLRGKVVSTRGLLVPLALVMPTGFVQQTQHGRTSGLLGASEALPHKGSRCLTGNKGKNLVPDSPSFFRKGSESDLSLSQLTKEVSGLIHLVGCVVFHYGLLWGC